MKFTKDFSKLLRDSFVEIRKNDGEYKKGKKFKVYSPEFTFMGEVVGVKKIPKREITTRVSLACHNCGYAELISMLDEANGVDFDDYVLIKVRKIPKTTSIVSAKDRRCAKCNRGKVSVYDFVCRCGGDVPCMFRVASFCKKCTSVAKDYCDDLCIYRERKRVEG